MKTILLTGFSPWGSHTYNSSWEILNGIDLTLPTGWNYETLLLPVSWSQAPSLLKSHLSEGVKGVVCFGMTSGHQVLVERIATNLVEPSHSVVDDIPHDSDHVCKDGPPAYWTGLPYNEICSALRNSDIACDTSRWAGDFLCNFIFYWLMHFLNQQMPGVAGGFVHVPAFGEQGMDRERLQAAVPIIVQSVISSLE